MLYQVVVELGLRRLYGNLSADGSGNAIEIASARLRRYNSSTLSAPNGRWLGWKSTSDENHLVQENNRQNADFKEFGKTYGSHTQRQHLEMGICFPITET